MTDPSGGIDPAALNDATTSEDGRETFDEVVREAPINNVVVHARGAVVTRRFRLESTDPSDKFALVCPDVTMGAEPSSVRCKVEGARRIHSVTTRVLIPERDTGPGPIRERVIALDRRIARLNDEHSTLVKRLEAMRAVELRPLLGRSLRTNGARSRAEEALAIGDLVDARLDTLSGRLAAIEKEHREVSRQREAAQLEDSQASGADRSGDGAPTRQIVLVFEPGSSDAAVEISYVVGPARWWPAYTLRVENEGRSASLLLEANVAQATGEDWSEVEIGLATSEIVSDAQLPNLPSYRLGRAQPEPPRAFRPPPEGVERLFVAFDLAMGGSDGSAMKPVPVSAPEPPPAARPEMEPDMASFGQMEIAAEMSRLDDDAPVERASLRASAPKKSKARSRMAAPAPQASMAIGGMAPGGFADGAGGAGPGAMAKAALPTRVEPSDGWLDFDDVLLAPPGSSNRGKLERRRGESAMPPGSLGEATRRADAVGSVDPLESRGAFDHRYDAQARADVPSDGALHRLEITQATCPASLGWRSNPREDSAVYREVTLDNPLPSPLLAGPLDVYAGGSLVANTQLESVDRGGAITAGLGIDDRIRIARNARIREESAGLLGGKREIDHFIDIDLASSLGFDAVVEIVDRIPVSRDEHVDVEMFECVPRADEYDQADRGAPVEGGYRWRIEVLAGDEATIRFAYRVKLRAKDELVGGNRRE